MGGFSPRRTPSSAPSRRELMKKTLFALLAAMRDSFAIANRARNMPPELRPAPHRQGESALDGDDSATVQFLFWCLTYLMLVVTPLGLYSLSYALPLAMIPLGAWYLVSWLIVPSFIVISALRAARNGKPNPLLANVAVVVLVLTLTAGVFTFAAWNPPLPLFALLPATILITAPMLGVIALDRIKHSYRRFVTGAMLIGVVVIMGGWIWTGAMPDGRDSFGVDRVAYAEEALHMLEVECIIRGAPENIDRGISNGQSKWRITSIDELADDRYLATVQFYTWMRIPTYAVTVPGCHRTQG